MNREKEPRKDSEKNPYLKGRQRKRQQHRRRRSWEAGGEAGPHIIKEVKVREHLKKAAAKRFRCCRQVN